MAAMFVIFLVPLFFVLLLGPISWRVDPGQGTASVPSGVIVTGRGSEMYIQCPSLGDWVRGSRRVECDDAIGWMAASAVLVAGGSIASTALFFFFRRARWREKNRVVEWREADHQPIGFRLDGMPFWFWAASVAVVPVTAVALVGTVVALAHGGRFSAAGVVFFTWVLYDIVWNNGVRRAYSVQIDGADLVWKAPLRTRTVPITALVSAGIPARAPSLRPQTVGMLQLSNGDRMAVALPDELRRWKFRRLCASLGERGVAVVEAGHLSSA